MNVIRLTLLSSLLLFLAGCGNAPEGMVKATGTVSWNGSPLESGFIWFTPDSGGVPQSARIEGGQFSLYAYEGENSVRIESTKKVGFVAGMNQHAYKQFLPDVYNKNTQLTAKLARDKPNELVYDLSGEED